MNNDDIEALFKRARLFDSDEDTVALDNVPLLLFFIYAGQRAKQKAIPIAFSYAQPERLISLRFRAPFTFEHCFAQLATYLKWILMQRIENRSVYLALIPKIERSFAKSDFEIASLDDLHRLSKEFVAQVMSDFLEDESIEGS